MISLLHLLPRSVLAKQCRHLLRQNIHTTTDPSLSNNPVIPNKLFEQIYFPHEGRKERLQILESWQTYSSVAHHFKDVLELRKNQPQEYREWMKEQGMGPPRVLRGFHTDFPSLEARFKIALLRHVDDLEQVLGYSFKHSSWDTLLTLFPRFPHKYRVQRVEEIDKSVILGLLGKSVVGLAMLDTNLWHKLDVKYVQNHEFATRLNSFVIDRETLEPMTINKMEQRKLLRNRGWDGHQLTLAVFGILGVVFRDGGMDAVKTVLNHSKFLNRAQSRYIKLHDLHVGDIAPKILFINSVYKKVDIAAHLHQFMNIRCKEPWFTRICSQPDVSEQIDAHFSKIRDQDKRSVGDDAGDGQSPWTDEVMKQSSRGLLYMGFLGAAYRDGGLDKVKDILNSHDPTYSCLKYPKKLQPAMLTFDKGLHKRPFWQTPTTS